MPKPSQRADVNTFTGGLITEASPLNFPPNAMADGVNFELHRDGRITRRLGMDFESGGVTSLTPFSTSAAIGYGTFRWEGAGGNPSVNYLVVQVGNYLYFYNLNTINISRDGVKGTIATGFPVDRFFSFAAVDGLLIIACGQEEIGVVEYVGGSLNYSTQRLITRDLWGVEETIEPNYESDVAFRGQSDNQQHRYNLMNQSWGIPRKNEFGVLVNPIDYFNSGLHLYPANNEQVWVGLQFQAVTSGQLPFERQYNNLYDDSRGAKPSAAKGYFLIDLLRRGQGRRDAIDSNNAKYAIMNTFYTPPADYTPGGTSVVAQFSGRVFYAGFSGEVIGGDKRSPILNNYVFFSQLIKNRQDINKCYQDGDPTSRDTADIVDTDGGFVKISGANNIIGLRALGVNLVVFAENGIWTITGGVDNGGFSATSYKITKLSSFGAVNNRAIIVENDSAFYWASDGIYSVARDQFGDYRVQSMTLQTIQDFYSNIPNDAKSGAFGEYDEINKKLRWVYKTGTKFTSTSETYELIFDSQLSAFTVNKIEAAANNVVELMSSFRTQIFIASDNNDTVVAGTEQVLSNTDDVVVPLNAVSSNRQFLKYLCFYNVNGVLFTAISEYRDTNFVDWRTIDGVGTDAKGFILTGDQTAGDSAVDKQITYLVFNFIRTESGVDSNYQPMFQSSCMFRVQWNFANAVQSNKWTPMWQAYRYRKALFVNSLADEWNSGFEIIQSKNKVRGRGKAFALYFETEPGKDCQIAGWNLTITGNSKT